MSEEAIFEKMEDYLLGKLSPEAATIFEAELAQHPEWQEEFDLRRIEHEGMELLLEVKIRTDMQKWDAEKKPQPLDLVTKNWRWIGLVLLICLGGILIFRQIRERNPKEPKPQPIETIENGTQAIEDQTVPVEKNTDPLLKKDKKNEPQSSTYIAFAEKAVGDLDMSFGIRGDEDAATVALFDSIDRALATKNYLNLLHLTKNPPAVHSANLRYLRAWTYFKLRKFNEAENISRTLFLENSMRFRVKSQRLLMYALLAQWPDKKELLTKLSDEIFSQQENPLRADIIEIRKLIEH